MAKRKGDSFQSYYDEKTRREWEAKGYQTRVISEREYLTYDWPSDGWITIGIGGAENSKTRLIARHKLTKKNPCGRAKNPDRRLVDAIGPGDRVTIVDRFGKERSGKAVMRSSHGGWVLNMGGPHGTPGIADDSNITRVSKSKKKPSGAAYFVAGRMSNPVDKNCPHCGAFATRCAGDESRRHATVCKVTGKVLQRWPKKSRRKNPDAFVIAMYHAKLPRLTYDAHSGRFTDNRKPSLYATRQAAEDRLVLLKKNYGHMPAIRDTKVEAAKADERGAVYGARVRRGNPGKRAKYGIGVHGNVLTIFKSKDVPTYASHGAKFGAVIGMFSTRAQMEKALLAQRRGSNVAYIVVDETRPKT